MNSLENSSMDADFPSASFTNDLLHDEINLVTETSYDQALNFSLPTE